MNINWRLCSHIVRVWRDPAGGASQGALIEEISENGVRLSSDIRYELAEKLTLDAGEDVFPVEVIRSVERDGEYVTEARFRGGYVWSVARWKPNHLYSIPAASSEERPPAAASRDDRPD